MSLLPRLRRGIAGLLLLNLMVSCGGGDEPSGGISSPPLAYTGLRSAATITEENIRSVAYESWEGIELGHVIQDFYLSPATFPIGEFSVTRRGPVSGSSTVTSNIALEGDGRVDVLFEEWSDGAGSINGRIRYTIARCSNCSAVNRLDITFDNLRVTTTGSQPEENESVTFAGTATTDIPTTSLPDENATHWLINVVVEDHIENRRTWIENLRMTQRQSISADLHIQRERTEEYSGRVFIDNFGYVDVQTETPLRTSTDSVVSTPYEGGPLLLKGSTASDVDVSIVPLSSVFAAIVLDVNHDGVPDKSARVEWTSAWDEVVASPPTKPNVVAGLNPKSAVGSSTRLNAMMSYDSDGDFLEFRWKMVFDPPGSKVALQGTNTPMPVFVPDVVGEYTFSVDISDGVNHTTDWVVVNVVLPDRLESTQAFSLFTLPRATTVGTKVELDGTPSYVSHVPERQQADRFEWRLRRTPAGSRASILFQNTPQDARVSFVPDLPGFYEIEMVASFSSHGYYTVTTNRKIAVDNPLPVLDSASMVIPGAIPEDPAIGDLNGDNRPDIALRFRDGSVAVLYADPQGGFDAPVPVEWMPINRPQDGLRIEDMDNDGRRDLIFATASDFIILKQIDTNLVLRQYPRSPPCLTNYASRMDIADINGDGLLDLVDFRSCFDSTTTELRSEAFVYLQNQAGYDSPISSTLPVAAGYFFDLDGNGRSNFVTIRTNFSNMFLEIMEGQSDGTLHGTQSIDIPDHYISGNIQALDFSGDGRLDIVIIAGDLEVLEQQADGSFGPLKLIPSTSLGGGSSLEPVSIQLLAEVTGDGLIDLLDATHLIPGTDNGYYPTKIALPSIPFNQLIDLNGDSVLDFMSYSLYLDSLGVEGVRLLFTFPRATLSPSGT